VSLGRAEPMKKSAVITSLLFLGLALGAFFESLRLPFGRVSAPAAGFFPAVLAALLAVTSLLAFAETLRGGGEGLVQRDRLIWKKILWTVASLLAFGFLFESLGYLVTTFLFVTCSLRVVERQGWGPAVAVGLCASLVSYIIFGLLLGAPLPAGFVRF